MTTEWHDRQVKDQKRGDMKHEARMKHDRQVSGDQELLICLTPTLTLRMSAWQKLAYAPQNTNGYPSSLLCPLPPFGTRVRDTHRGVPPTACLRQDCTVVFQSTNS